MKIQKSEKFEEGLEKIALYIAKDSKKKALNFQKKLKKVLSSLDFMPYKYRKSFYYSNENIRDCIYKGYTIPYLIDDKKDVIIILDIFKWIDR